MSNGIFFATGAKLPTGINVQPGPSETTEVAQVCGSEGKAIAFGTNRSWSMKGVIWHIYRNQQKGMIRGDDGAQVPFRKSALNGAEFHTLSSGQRVRYRVRDGWLGKEAVEVHPLPEEEIAGLG